MSIQALPGDVVAQIKSSIVITSLNGVVYGLLQNALDAGASKVSISIDYGRGNCSVEDDGQGIPPSDFRDGGGLGELHYTSKYPPRVELHGRHGTFLAALAALSLLTISSHHREYRSHNALTIHNSKVVARNTPALPEQELLVFASGTRVTVRDLFGSMPVRVKQRAIEADRLGSARNFDRLILTIVALVISWQHEVVVSVRDTTSRRNVSFLSSELAFERQTRKSLSRSIITRTEKLLAEASLVEGCDSESWVPLGASAHGVSVNGCVSLIPVATRRLQFISLGVRPLLNDHDSNVLYDAVNRVFVNSSFGAIEESAPSEMKSPQKIDSSTTKELKVRKGPDRWPVFYLRIDLDEKMEFLNADADLEEGSGHSGLATVTDLLRVLVYEFLKKNHFRPKSVNAFEELKTPKSSSDRQSQPSEGSLVLQMAKTDRAAKRQRLATGPRRSGISRPNMSLQASKARASSPFALWSRAKADLPCGKLSKSVSSSLISPLTAGPCPVGENEDASADVSESSSDWNPLFDHSGKLLRKPFDDVEESSTAETSVPAVDGQQDGSTPATRGVDASDTLIWRDPVTKIRTLVDRRIGFVVKGITKAGERSQPRARPTNNTKLPLRGALQSLRPGLSTLNGRIFEPRELPIPYVPQIPEPLCFGQFASHQQCGDLEEVNIDVQSGVQSKVFQGRISKDALREAVVVGQVDRKFILVKVVTVQSPGFTLVLIDQHAADERCRVEDLMKGYFAMADEKVEAIVEPLEKPLRFDFSRQEGQLLDRFRGHFQHWGVGFELLQDERPLTSSRPNEKSTVTVEVQKLPASIVERCRLEPRLLVELLRKEVWKLCDNPCRILTEDPERPRADDRDWVARFHRCPDGIQELINSRACRSAIMFNDPLTAEDCGDLVRRLAACAFPFQCAHGRPSMIPLVDMSGADIFGWDESEVNKSTKGKS